MSSFDNNQFEVKPSAKSKRKITTPCPNVYLNPGLDLLANEDPMCNTAMEIMPMKKRKRSKSCDIASFENTGLDIGVNKAVVNEFLVRELDNVRKAVRSCETIVQEESMCADTEKIEPKETIVQSLSTDKENINPETEEPIYQNLTDLSLNKPTSIGMSVVEDTPAPMELSGFQPDISDIEMDSGISCLEQKSTTLLSENATGNITNIQKNITNQVIVNNTSNISLSFIDRLGLNSPNLSNQSLYLDDDLNESNIMEIKTITIITKKKRIIDKKQNTNPFLDPNINDICPESVENPFLIENVSKPELEYTEEVSNRPLEVNLPQENLQPRRLFTTIDNSTISTVNESMGTETHEYENIDHYRAESPIYENIGGDVEERDEPINKQSKVLGCDVSRFSAKDIMNLNKNSEANSSNDSNDSRRDLKHQFLKVGNKLSKKVFKTLKRTFKHDKVDNNVTLNPYEVPRKPPKQKVEKKDSGIENPALNLDNSDEIEIEELDDEHLYETVKTLRNTQLNMNVTPLRERMSDNLDFSLGKTTPGKKVRFDSTLNQEKVITGNSFDYDIQSPGFDAKIDKYHDELENCINERKFIQQNM